MTSTKPARVSKTGAAPYLRSREPFIANDNFEGVLGAAYTGRLNYHDEHYADYRAAEEAGRIVYTVRSYATPIAWVLTTGEVVIPNVKYSTTTSSHQTIVRNNLR